MKKFINNLFDSKIPDRVNEKEKDGFDDEPVPEKAIDRTADLQEALISANLAFKEKEDALLARDKELAKKESEIASRNKILDDKERRLGEWEQNLGEWEKHLNGQKQKLYDREMALDKKIQKQIEHDKAPIVPEPVRQENLQTDEILRRLKRIEAVVIESDHKDKIIRELHDDLQKKNRDFYSELTRPAVKSIVRIHDFVGGMLLHSLYKEGEDAEMALKRLTKAVGNSCQMIEDMLNDEFGVEIYAPEKGEPYSPKVQSAIMSVDTDNPAIAGTIHDCRQAGFRETETGRLVRKAMVEVYKLKK